VLQLVRGDGRMIYCTEVRHLPTLGHVGVGHA
jgi:hypothetical protein